MLDLSSEYSISRHGLSLYSIYVIALPFFIAFKFYIFSIFSEIAFSLITTWLLFWIDSELLNLDDCNVEDNSHLIRCVMNLTILVKLPSSRIREWPARPDNLCYIHTCFSLLNDSVSATRQLPYFTRSLVLLSFWKK